MQIEVTNLMIIAIIVFLAAIIFIIRKKKILFVILSIAAILMMAKAISLKTAINNAKETLSNGIETVTAEDGDETLDVDIDVDGIKDNLEETVDEALPDNLYVIDDTRKGFGLDYDRTDDTAEGVIEQIENFVGDTNK